MGASYRVPHRKMPRDEGGISALIAWAICGLILVLIAVFVVLSVPNGWPFRSLVIGVIGEATAALVGGLVASRIPSNPVGWIILAHASFFTLGEFCRQYAIYGLSTEPGSLPLATVAASPPYWAWFPGLMLALSFLPLYFPDGKLASPRWRPVTALAVVVTVFLTVTAVLRPDSLETAGIPNPLGIRGLGPFFGTVDVLIPVAWLAMSSASVASLVVRFRRSRGEERQQIKWFAFAMVAVVLLTIANQALFGELGSIGTAVLGAVVFTLPWVAIAVSVLRYRLYDIDLVVNRAIVYAALTSALVLSYLAGVVVLESLFRAFTGQGSSLAVVASTLGIAALFNPLRRRVQRFVDRLFYRRRYDAAKILGALSAKLRDESDPDRLGEDLVGVLSATVQPAHASLWLRPLPGEHDPEDRGGPYGEG